MGPSLAIVDWLRGETNAEEEEEVVEEEEEEDDLFKLNRVSF